MTTKDVLLKLTEIAYNGDEMSLLCGVFARKWVPPCNLVPDPDRNLTDKGSQQMIDGWDKSILNLLVHVADCKALYMKQAFGSPNEDFPSTGDTLESILSYLDATQRHLVSCLEELPDADLPKPVPTQCHGESAANLFLVLAQHDIHHGSQIKLLHKLIGDW